MVLSTESLIWAYGASLHQPLRLTELWGALAVPEKKDRGLLGWDPFWTHRVQIDNWSQFHRSPLDLCGPLLDFLPPKIVEQNRLDDQLGKVGPSDIIQLLHSTAKEFLSSSKAAKCLAFPLEDATMLVGNGSKLYTEITLPTNPTEFSLLLVRAESGSDRLTLDENRRRVNVTER